LQDGALIRAQFAREENPEVERIAREEVERAREEEDEDPAWAIAVVDGATERAARAAAQPPQQQVVAEEEAPVVDLALAALVTTLGHTRIHAGFNFQDIATIPTALDRLTEDQRDALVDIINQVMANTAIHIDQRRDPRGNLVNLGLWGINDPETAAAPAQPQQPVAVAQAPVQAATQVHAPDPVPPAAAPQQQVAAAQPPQQPVAADDDSESAEFDGYHISPAVAVAIAETDPARRLSIIMGFGLDDFRDATTVNGAGVLDRLNGEERDALIQRVNEVMDNITIHIRSRREIRHLLRHIGFKNINEPTEAAPEEYEEDEEQWAVAAALPPPPPSAYATISNILIC
jgi:hypothetical protein